MDQTRHLPGDWDDSGGVVRYNSPDLGWIEPTHAVIIDAGDNVLADVPAREWRRVARKHARWLRTGRAYLVGVVRGEDGHPVATACATTCDRCGEEISEAEAEAGWPVASDDGHLCPGCYGPEAYCSTCGDVLPAHEEGSRCPSCAKARGGV